jgi:hypothetical protein
MQSSDYAGHLRAVPVVGWVTVEMRRCKHDTRHPELCCLHKVGPPGHAPSAVPPSRRLLVEPPAVRQAADEGEVWSPTALTPTFSAVEANLAAQFAPVRWIERSQLRAYRHGYVAFFPSTR